MSGQKVTVTLDIQAQVDKAKSAIQNLTKQMSNMNLPSGVTKALETNIKKITQELNTVEDQLSFQNLDSKNLQKIGSNMTKIGSQFENIRNTINGIDSTALTDIFSASVVNSINKATEAIKKYEKSIGNAGKAEEANVKKAEKDNIAAQKKYNNLANKTILSDTDYLALSKSKASATRKATAAQSALDSRKQAIADYEAQYLQTKPNGRPKTTNEYKILVNGDPNGTKNAIKSLQQLEEEAKKANETQIQLTETYNNSINTSEFEKAEKAVNDTATALTLAKDKLDQLKQADEVNALQTLKEDLKDIDEIKDFDSVDELKQQLVSLSNDAIQKVNEKLQKFDDAIEEGGNAAEEAAPKIKEAETSVEQLTDTRDNIDSLRQKLTALFSMDSAINIFRRAVRQAFETIKELDATMTETAVVSDETVGSMWSHIDEYTDEANKLGVAINDVIAAQTLYVQQGLSLDTSLGMATETMKMARIAGMDAAEATDAMTAAIRGFNMAIDETSAKNINDVYSNLAAITASDTQELATAMSKVASIASSANMEFENTAAFLAQIIETTREAPETAGTALKTVIARFSEVKKLYSEGELKGTDEEGEAISVNKVSDALATAGINMNEFFTGTKGLDDIFIELAEKWDTLDIVQQRYIATQAAGSRQQSRFLALMSDSKRLTELTTEAFNSAGASETQFNKTQESLQSKLAKLQNAWNEFVTTIINSDLIKNAVDFGTKILTIVNDITGNSGLAKVAVLLGAFKTGGAIIRSVTGELAKLVTISGKSIEISTKSLSLFTGLHNGFKGLGASITGTAGNIADFCKTLAQADKSTVLIGSSGAKAGAKMAELGFTLGSLATTIGIVIAATGALALAWRFLTEDGLAKGAENARKKLEGITSELDNTKSEIETIDDKIKELQDRGPLELTDQRQLDLLKAEKAELEANLKLLKQNQAEQNKKVVERSRKLANKIRNQGGTVIRTDEMTGEALEVDRPDRQERYTELMSANTDMIADFENLTDEELADLQKNVAYEISEGLALGLLDLSDVIAREVGAGMIEGLSEEEIDAKLAEIANEEDSNIQRWKLRDLMGQENFDQLLAENDLEDITQAIESYREEIKNAAEDTKDAVKDIKDSFTDLMSNATKDLKKISDDFANFGSAFNEIEENKFVSMDTISGIDSMLSEVGATNYGESLKALSNASNVEEAQKAIDDLASAYINAEGVLSNLNEETADYYKTELQKIGVSNADKIIEFELAKAKWEEAEATGEGVDAAWEAYKALWQEQVALGNVKVAAVEGYSELEVFNGVNASITPNANLDAIAGQLIGIAQNAGIAVQYISALESAKANYNRVKNYTGDKNSTGYKRALNQYTNDIVNAAKDVQKKLNNAITTPDIKLNKIKTPGYTPPGGGGGKGSTGSGSGSGNDTKVKNEYEWTYNLIARINKELRRREKLENNYQKLLDGTYLKYQRIANSKIDSSKADETIVKQLKKNVDTQIGELNRVIKNNQKIIDGYDDRFLKKKGTSKSYAKNKKTENGVAYSKYTDYVYYNEKYNEVQIDWKKINKLNGSTKESDQKKYEDISEIISYYEEVVSTVEDAEDKIDDAKDAIKELHNIGQNSYKEVEEALFDALVEQRQKEINQLEKINDSITDANSKLIDAMQKSIDKSRQERDNQKTEDEIAEKQRRLSYLRQDTSGANLMTIKQLEKEIAEAQQDYQDDLIDQKLDDMQETFDIAEEQRQQQIDLMNAQLEYDKLYGKFWPEVESIIAQGPTAIAKALQGTDTFGMMSSEQQERWTQEWMGKIVEAILYVQDRASEYYGHEKNGFTSGESVKVTTGASGNGTVYKGTYNEKLGGVVYTGKDGMAYLTSTENWDEESGTIKTLGKAEKLGHLLGLPNSSNLTEAQVKALKTGLIAWKKDNITKAKEYGVNLNDKQFSLDANDGTYGTNLKNVMQIFKRIELGWGPSGLNGEWTSQVYDAVIRRKDKLKKYASGGLADYTGLAWLDGTPSKPEVVLNARDSENFLKLKDILAHSFSKATSSSVAGDTNYEININVDSIASDYDVDKIADRIKQIIYKDSSYRNVNAVRYIR